MAPPKLTSKETLNRLGCRVCPFNCSKNITPKMPPKLKKGDIYVLGEWPDKEADEAGKHYAGKTANLLNEIFGSRGPISFDHVIRDYDHVNDGSGSNEQAARYRAMECCRGLVEKSIEEAKPRVILGLGFMPLQWFRNSSDMVALRGRLFAVRVGVHSCYFIPTYSPSYVIDKAFNKSRPLRSFFGHCLKFDIERAIAASKLPPVVLEDPKAIRAGIQCFDGHGADDLTQLLKLISEAAKAPVKAIDVETSPLRPYAAGAKLLTMAISYNKTNFAFAIEHKNAGWTKGQLIQISNAVYDLLLSEGRIVAHNAPFEIEWLIYWVGRDAIIHKNWECTMMQSHFLDERRGKKGGNDEQFRPNPYQALDFLIHQYFGISYKPTFKLDRKNMANADLGEILLYNGADTKYTLKLFYLQERRLCENDLDQAYEEARERQPTVALMQSAGIVIDQSQSKKIHKKLTREIATIEAEIKAYPEVQAYIRDWKSFNPASGQEVIKLLKNYLKIGKALVNDEGRESSDKGILDQISHPFAKSLDNFRNRSKLKSTYVDPFQQGPSSLVWPDGRIHPSFNTTFAETGRTSSDEPNQQNWPSRRDKWVRRQVVPRTGYVLVAFDYGQVEACTTAMCSQDKVLIDALWNDYDIHLEWARRAADIYPTFIGGKQNITNKDIMKKFRSLIKNKLVFPVFFGASNKSVGGYLRFATKTDVPQNKVDALMEEFWDKFRETKQWQKRLVDDYYDCGFVSSPTGRRHHYPLTSNQAINYPIQSVACDIICRSMVSLSKLAHATGNYYYQPIMNIHDDLTFCIPEKTSILEPAIETIYRTMLAPGYDFINVPLSVTCSVGNNWTDMDEVGKFWSHKDL